MTIIGPGGCPRLPLEAAAERSRPRSHFGKGRYASPHPHHHLSAFKAPQAPATGDVRADEEFHADPRLLPTSQRGTFRPVVSRFCGVGNRGDVLLGGTDNPVSIGPLDRRPKSALVKGEQ